MEYFDIVDEKGRPLGGTVERSRAHAEGIRHRTSHIWFVREQDGRIRVLLQKRAAGKDSYPLCWDTSAAGHIMAGDEPLESAVRETAEELGLHVRPEEMEFAGVCLLSFNKEFYGSMFRDRETAFLYVCDRDVAPEELRLQAEEVEAADWFDLEDVREAVRKHDPAFCVPPEELDALAEYLQSRQT